VQLFPEPDEHLPTSRMHSLPKVPHSILARIVDGLQLEAKIPVHLNQSASVRLVPVVGLGVDQAWNPHPARTDGGRMDRWLGFPKVFTVQIQHIRSRIARAPNGCGGEPSDIQPIGARPMLRNREILGHDSTVWHRVNDTTLTGDCAPSHMGWMSDG